jgi:hypothetical protein
MGLQSQNLTVMTPPQMQICSLCFQCYPASEELVCTKCEGNSCPECAETKRETGQVVCFACP